MKDLFGKAILDYQTRNNPQNLMTETSISEEDEMEVAYLFRDFKHMPKIEQKALQMAKGNILDVGCGAGSHSLYLKNVRNKRVQPIDISASAIEACKLRGLDNAQVADILTYNGGTFDTILLLMNGTGIFGKLENVTQYLTKLKSLLDEGGQILIDSSDLIYMFDEDEDGGKWIPAEGYYGEITFTVSYKGETEEPFDWLYLDYNTLQNAAHANGLNCELVMEGEHYDYLARLTL
ncbi:methyltransferase [Flavobacterium akiainvivens]|uniref:Methyltransferase n=1 Tax=Flavobacterium akiainvivens TaxID=1202724 RepID=A0A0M9VJB2_9FLAO|nr:class I SAM-dependent methyltransferase [Flavobacterium akiainvivens]KOS07542.1 methyltransferase [Flavobacterium akiainvivens]SFQ64298.1 Methyltransferase domain-containing protein [Flavobacterium akiainvivens]